MNKKIPAYIDFAVIPLVNILLAFIVSGVIISFTGENPLQALVIMLQGAFGYPAAIGYTLYYTTNFIFTGLAAAVAFRASLFNIGAEGQAYLGGLGVAVVMLSLDRFLPFYLLIPLGILGAALFGALWAFIPAWLQAYKGSHIVITTIMFNFIASALMVYLLAHILIEPGQQAPKTRTFIAEAKLLSIDSVLKFFGVEMGNNPLNLSFVIALILAGEEFKGGKSIWTTLLRKLLKKVFYKV